MHRLRKVRVAALLTALAMATTACGGVGRGGGATPSDAAHGVTDKQIVLGTSLALSGPLSVYGNFAAAMEAYFNYVNDQDGGIGGRKIKLITYDDAFEPSRTLENVRRLTEQDKVFAIVGIVGTQPNLGVLDYTNQKKMPALFLGAGTAKLGDDPKAHPYTVPYLPPYPAEGAVVAKAIVKEKPNATVAVLARDDDGGKDWIKGFKKGIEGSNVKIVAQEVADVNAPTVDSQMVNLATSNADVFLNINNPKQATQAITFIAGSKWKPQQYLASYASSIVSTLKPAGLENAKGILSTQYLKDPADPAFANDPLTKKYLDIVTKYAPKVNANDVNTVVSGVVAAQMMVDALKGMKEPTSAGLMKSVESMKDVKIDMLLPGVTVTVSKDDHYALQCLQMQKFTGTRYELIGDVVCG
jgi:branched-chain amino acid transport system substrate-binding protein